MSHPIDREAGSQMPSVMIICPKTGNPISTGIAMDAASYETEVSAKTRSTACHTMVLDGLVEQLKETHQGDREDEQFRGTIRTALWTLRKEGIIVAAKGKGNHIGVKWLPENASAPESGAEVAVPTSGAGGDSLAELDQDHGDSFADGNRDESKWSLRSGDPFGTVHI